MDEVKEATEVGIGMIAGWPTWQQYAGAAQRALTRAAMIAMRDEDTKVDTGGRLNSAAITVTEILETGAKP